MIMDTFRIFERVFPLMMLLDDNDRIVRISDALLRELQPDTQGQQFFECFQVVRPRTFDASVSVRRHADSLFLFHTRDGRFGMRAQVVAALEGEPGTFLLITPWLTWMQDQAPTRPIPPEMFPLVDAQMDLHIHLATQSMMLSDLQALAQDLQVATDEARAANAAKSVFVNHVSHELRTPLNGIVSAVHLLEKETQGEQARDLLSIVRASSVSLLEIINQVLDYSGLTSSGVVLYEKEFSPVDLVNDVVNVLIISARERGIRIVLHADPAADEYVSADAAKIRNILMNLLGNAVRYAVPGEVRIHLGYSGIDQNNVLLRIEVEDDGPGIAADKRAVLFEPFTNFHAGIQQRGSSGLGLSIAHTAVSLMRGHIGLVNASNGAGSKFWFTVPVKKCARSPVPEAECNSGLLAGKVLLVDDNVFNLKLGSMLLTNIGLEVVTADSGEAAILTVLQNEFDLILMDIRMPGMDGLEATRRIRGLRQYQQVPIIAWTANAAAEEESLWLQTGMSDRLVKPVTPENLRRFLQRWLPCQPAS